jgi:hypothetical protein
MRPNGQRAPAGGAVQGWCSGETHFRVELKTPTGEELAPAFEATMILQLVPLGAMVLVMGCAWTDEPRVPEPARELSLTYATRLPRLTLGLNPFDELAQKSVANFCQLATNHFAHQIAAATSPPIQPRSLGIP